MTIDFTAAPVSGDLDVRWIHGTRAKINTGDPKIQIHRYDEHTYMLRQSKSVHYEAPFMFLLFGNDRVVLFDTGATGDAEAFPLRATVDGIVAAWLREHPRDAYQLVVAHTHAHGDHIAGDGQFTDRPFTTIVGTDLASLTAHYGISAWPEQVVSYDLGGRTLEITGVPGHHATSIAVFDRWTGFLLTGDSVYPGRLYAPDMSTFVASMDRLVEFAQARAVTHVMGCHIEMSRVPRRDYPIGTTFQPDEPPLQMTMAQLLAVRDAARTAATKPGVHVFDDFIVFNGTGRMATVKLLARTARQRLIRR